MLRKILSYRHRLFAIIGLALLAIPFVTYGNRFSVMSVLFLGLIALTTAAYIHIYTVAMGGFRPFRRMAANLDLLILANADPLTLRRKIWRDLFAGTGCLTFAGWLFARLGMAVGLSHALHIGFQSTISYNAVFAGLPLHYVSHNGSYDLVYWQAVWWQYGLAILVIVAFLFLEIRLLITICAAVQGFRQKSKWGLLAHFISIRVAIMLVAFAVNAGFSILSAYVRPPDRYITDTACMNDEGHYDPMNSLIARYNYSASPHEYCRDFFLKFQARRVVETAQLSAYSLVDGGMVIGTHLLRPGLSRQFRTDSFMYRPGREGPSSWEGFRDVRYNISAWWFVLRMLASALLGALLYLLLTRWLLRYACYDRDSGR